LTIKELVLRSGRKLLGEEPTLIFEGKTVEANEFYGDPLTFQQKYCFRAEIELEDGLSKLVKFLESTRK
jgi:hypothetical protein